MTGMTFRLTSFTTMHAAVCSFMVALAVNDNVIGAAKVCDDALNRDNKSTSVVLVRRLDYRLGRGTEMRKGDMVVVTSPMNPNVKLVSTVQCVQGEYVRWNYGEILPVPAGSCLLENLGFCSLALIDGRAEAVLWGKLRLR